MTEESKQIGRVTVEVFARVGDGPEVDLGTVWVPLTTRMMQKNHLDVNLDGVFEVTKATLQRIYAE